MNPETSITPEIPANDSPIAIEAVAVPGQIHDIQGAVEHPSAETLIPAIGTISNIVDAAPAIVTETRRGWKTSEFWVGIAAAAQAVATELPATDKVALIALAAVYAVARAIAKHGSTAVVVPSPPA